MENIQQKRTHTTQHRQGNRAIFTIQILSLKFSLLIGCNPSSLAQGTSLTPFNLRQRPSSLAPTAVEKKNIENCSCRPTSSVQATAVGSLPIPMAIGCMYRIAPQKVAENRYVLNIIINCIRFCGSFELALRCHDESETSSNPGNFRGLVNFISELDSAMRNHLEKASVFKGTSKTIQNEILMCMLEVCHEEISKEMRNSDFVALIADETSDVASFSQLVIVFRYLAVAARAGGSVVQ